MTFPSICDKKTPSFLAPFKDIFDLMKKRNSHSASGKLVVKWPKNLTCVFLLLTLLNISVVISFIFLQLLFVLQGLVKFCIIQMCWCVLCYFDFLPFYCPLLSSSSFTIRAGSPPDKSQRSTFPHIISFCLHLSTLMVTAPKDYARYKNFALPPPSSLLLSHRHW